MVSSHKNIILLAGPGMDGFKLLIRPRNNWSLVEDLGVRRSCRAWTLEGSSCKPFAVNKAL